MSEREQVVLPDIEIERLRVAWGVLRQMFGHYWPDTAECAAICEARRLVEIEIRETYGDEEWRRITDS